MCALPLPAAAVGAVQQPLAGVVQQVKHQLKTAGPPVVGCSKGEWRVLAWESENSAE